MPHPIDAVPETNPDPATAGIRQRLARLASMDPAAADWLASAAIAANGRATAAPPTADALTVAGAWLANAEHPDVVIIPGVGTGPEVAALLALLPDRSKALLLERSPAQAARLFVGADLETLVEQGRLQLAFGEDRDEAECRLLALLDLPKGPTLRVFDQVQASADDQAFYAEMLLCIRGHVRTKVFNLGTLVQHGCRCNFCD